MIKWNKHLEGVRSEWLKNDNVNNYGVEYDKVGRNRIPSITLPQEIDSTIISLISIYSVDKLLKGSIKSKS